MASHLAYPNQGGNHSVALRFSVSEYAAQKLNGRGVLAIEYRAVSESGQSLAGQCSDNDNAGNVSIQDDGVGNISNKNVTDVSLDVPEVRFRCDLVDEPGLELDEDRNWVRRGGWDSILVPDGVQMNMHPCGAPGSPSVYFNSTGLVAGEYVILLMVTLPECLPSPVWDVILRDEAGDVIDMRPDFKGLTHRLPSQSFPVTPLPLIWTDASLGALNEVTVSLVGKGIGELSIDWFGVRMPEGVKHRLKDYPGDVRFTPKLSEAPWALNISNPVDNMLFVKVNPVNFTDSNVHSVAFDVQMPEEGDTWPVYNVWFVVLCNGPCADEEVSAPVMLQSEDQNSQSGDSRRAQETERIPRWKSLTDAYAEMNDSGQNLSYRRTQEETNDASQQNTEDGNLEGPTDGENSGSAAEIVQDVVRIRFILKGFQIGEVHEKYRQREAAECRRSCSLPFFTAVVLILCGFGI
eukprot:gnl/MRDRNA2_/MRDRNA2_145634_c0_seq1.p1 gnl/MRDRNA2_/MRDRNA2_145634_c0~~gnl/MRDRNA2_/MRDRNA2_145634_c0_seq1.p1  ORF type:complete len:542 (-),score=91.00 gnl/MRDRNA2_/MRDRNA2_145634_c0_seq1:16-1404(-)